jgi:hypothetical protein
MWSSWRSAATTKTEHPVRWSPGRFREARWTSCPSRPQYAIRPGDRIEVEVVQPDGGRALVVGKLDAVPGSAGGRALRIVVWIYDAGSEREARPGSGLLPIACPGARR